LNIEKLPKSALNIAKRAGEHILLTEPPDIPDKAILYALAKKTTSITLISQNYVLY